MLRCLQEKSLLFVSIIAIVLNVIIKKLVINEILFKTGYCNISYWENNCFSCGSYFFHPSQLGIPSKTLNTSKDLICDVPSFSCNVTNHKQPTIQQESNTKPSAVFRSNAHSYSGTVLREVSFNDVDEWMKSSKCPLLCSTPSLVFKRSLNCPEPFINEISSFSCDEFDKHQPVNKSTANNLMKESLKRGMLQESKECAKQTPNVETMRQLEDPAKCTNGQSSLTLGKCQKSIVCAQPHLKQLKKR